MNFKGKISGKGQITLDSKDYLTSGGQASIYAKKDIAYKLYTDPKNMIPIQKINELSVLNMPNIIRPLDIILDNKNDPVGYTMPYLKDTGALCQLFTKAFKDRHNIKNDTIIKLVQRMQETQQYIHNNGFLLVDNNEMNFLINSCFNEVYFIDVDSYQTKSFPANFIMESIRDRHCNNKFTTLTDWFSFGIVTFQMFIGIHPYKGKHPKLNGFDERMLANVSVFNKNVILPKVCYSFDVIPQAYKEWYKAVFEDGKRIPPPNTLIPVIVITPKIDKISGTNNFDIKEIIVVSNIITDYISVNGVRIMLSGEDIYVNDKIIFSKNKNKDNIISVSPKTGKIILGNIEKNKLNLFNASDNKKIDIDIKAESLMSTDGRLYFKSSGTIYEIFYYEGNNLIVSSNAVANVHENATKLFSGVAMQNLFGTHWATIFPRTKESYSIKLKEITGQIIEAKYENNVLMVVSVDKGIYSKYTFRFSNDYSEYDIKIENSSTFTGLNFVVIDTGICCSINENEDLVLYRNKKDDTLIKTITDPEIKGDIRLYKNGNTVLFSYDKILYSLKMK